MPVEIEANDRTKTVRVTFGPTQPDFQLRDRVANHLRTHYHATVTSVTWAAGRAAGLYTSTSEAETRLAIASELLEVG